MDSLIKGVVLTSLKIITGESGNVMYALKAAEDTFNGFGEAYFSTVKKGSVKGWKCHSKMTLNLVVPVGKIRFVIYDDRKESATYNKFNEFFLGSDFQYARLTIAPALKDKYKVVLSGRNNGQNRLIEETTGCLVLPMDVVNIEAVRDTFAEVRPDVVIHAAAIKLVDLSERQPMECIEVNVVGSQNIARVAIEKEKARGILFPESLETGRDKFGRPVEVIP